MALCFMIAELTGWFHGFSYNDEAEHPGGESVWQEKLLASWQ